MNYWKFPHDLPYQMTWILSPWPEMAALWSSIRIQRYENTVERVQAGKESCDGRWNLLICFRKCETDPNHGNIKIATHAYMISELNFHC